MNATEILKKLREQFNEIVKNAEMPTTPPTAPASAPTTAPAPEMNVPIKSKLKDGTEIEITEMEVGGIVTILGQPAPIGEHTLEDDTIITIGDNGAITAIAIANGTTPPIVEDMAKKKMGMEEIFSAFQTSTNEKFTSYESKFASYEERFSAYEIKLNRAVQVIDGLLDLTTKLSATPTGTPDNSVKISNNFNENKIEDKWSGYDTLFS